MKISGERLLSDLNILKRCTDTPGAGVTRFSYGDSDGKARKYLKETAESFGFSVRTDPVGNMYIGHAGMQQKKEKICVGSHIDTVRNGGWLDGIYGVAGGLEVLRTLAESSSERSWEVELVIFAEEEGSNFGSTMTGSKFITGIYKENDLDRLKNDAGISLREILSKSGYPHYTEDDVIWEFSRIKAMLELHIEQGPVLEQSGNSIGIVDGIFGMTAIETVITGIGNHAGATPMKYRRDAMAAAALCITETERIAKEDPEGLLVATVGKIAVSPNCSNVIPEKVTFSLEVREKREERIREAVKKIKESFSAIAEQRGVTCETRKISESKPFHMDDGLIRLMDQLAADSGISRRIMDSGAVHDACMIAPHVPSAMIFVPSIGGRSHVPHEDTDTKDLIRGVQLLLDTVLNI